MATGTKGNHDTGRKRQPAKKTASGKKRSSSPAKRTAAVTKNAQGITVWDEILLWVVLAFSVIILISNFGIGGFIGNAISSFFFGIFGFLTYILPFALFLTIAFVVSNRGNKIAWVKTSAVFLLWVWLCALAELLINGYDGSRKFADFYALSSGYKTGGGFIGGLVSKPLAAALGVAGAYVVLVALTIICFVLITERSLFAGMQKGGKKVYQTAKKDVDLRREKAQIRREKRELLRQRRLEEERERLKAERENMSILPDEPRMEKRVSGVSLNTLVGSEAAAVTEIHEVVPGISADSLDKAEFTIQRGGMEEILSGENPATEAPVYEMPDDANGHFANGPSNHETEVSEIEPVQPMEGKSVKNPKSSLKDQEKEMMAVAMEIEQAAQNRKPEYVFPPMNLLKKPKRGKSGSTDRELTETAVKLQQTLHNFGVEVSVTNVSCGPSVTRYELTPKQGVKVSRIVSLSDDIKLNLAAADIRIEAPIPGKAAVGIEVPNKENSAVMLRELLESREFKEHPSNLAFAAGKDIAGKVVVTDIARMPHLLIAGATGSGKSVCINTIIMSILYKADPEDVKLIMIDPKVVELSVYNGIPHLFIPVVTDPKKAAGALNWGVAEMTDRYKKFADLNVRDLKGYNAKVETLDDIIDENKPEKLPQIVIIVDELADLMMVAPGEVEDSICRLAQLARAAGIHLIIATQRPSVNVITGLIKANMPSRIAFSVSSGVDSRTIIDMNGAEKLLGKGDMLFYPQGYQKPARVQGAFVSDSEVAAVVEFLTQKNTHEGYSQEIEEQISKVQQVVEPGGSGSEVDRYFAEAGKFIIEKDKASIGMLQRVFKIGFNRAARIMDQLSDAGVVGPEEGTKPRKVLMSMEEFEQYLEEHV